MGEEVKIVNYDNAGGAVDDRVMEWESGLPSLDDLTPLSQALIPIELAAAFKISPEPSRSVLDVNRASQKTLSSIRTATAGGTPHNHHHHSQALSSSNNFNNLKSLNDDTTTTTTTTVTRTRDHMVMDIDEADLIREGFDSRKSRRIIDGGGGTEEADSAARNANNNSNTIENGGEDGSAKTLKRQRLVWTAQLHKRFVDVVGHLGIKSAVPKTIMQLMNVEGLTRENVASHLQKYRLYLKRLQGLSTEGPSPSDHLFASTPVPQSLHESAGGTSHGTGHGHGHGHPNSNNNPHMGMLPMQMPYHPPNGAQMVPMPVMGMPGHMGMPGPPPGGFPGYESHHHHPHTQYGMMQQQQQQRDWSGNNFGSVLSYPHHVPSNDS